MVKYVEMALHTARYVGEVKEMEMREASKYLPARIEITGTTEDGMYFELELKVGDPKRENS